MSAQKATDKIYSGQEIEERLKSTLPHWSYGDAHLRRKYRTHGWKGTLMAVNAVGHLAEVAWHHPDLVVSYNSVEVLLKSHDVNGITDRDFALAKKIEDIIQWQPAKEGGPFTGTPQDARHAYMHYD